MSDAPSTEWRGRAPAEEAEIFSRHVHPVARELFRKLLEGRGRKALAVASVYIARGMIAIAIPILVKIAIDDGIPELEHGEGGQLVAIVFAALCVLAIVQATLDYTVDNMMGKLGQEIL